MIIKMICHVDIVYLQYERYKNFATEEYVIKNGGVLCPNPKCGQGMIPETNANTICCLNCQVSKCQK